MLTAAERDGCHSHGLHRLNAFATGCSTVNATAVPTIATPRPAAVVVDAGGGFQPLAQRMGLPVLQERARANGIAMMALTNSAGMSGAMWYLAEELANAGLVSMVFANTPAYLAQHGGKQRVYVMPSRATPKPKPCLTARTFLLDHFTQHNFLYRCIHL
jgi:delta1-piperideine-2-carboxylate reductase